jgi:hypothetical protein
MMQHPGYDSLVMRAGFLLIAHVFLLAGLLVMVLALLGAKGKNGPIPPSAKVINLAVCFAAAYALLTRWYGFRWMMRRSYLAWRGKDLKVSYSFTPRQIESSSPISQSRRDWSLIDRVVEFADGFVLISGTVPEWLPRHAFAKEDDSVFAQMARSRAGAFKQIVRRAALTPPDGRIPTLADGNSLDQFD